MKSPYQSFEDWKKLFVSEENRLTFECLKDRMSFCSPNSHYTTLRFEIHNCLVFGMNQAALTLTNHYLERFLKMTLIEHHLTNRLDKISDYSNEVELNVKKFGSKDLEQSINNAKGLGLITKTEGKMLKGFKDTFRNPFSHNDISELFGDETVNLWQFSINEPSTPKQQVEVKISSFLPFQSARQDDIAKSAAFAYFIFVDDLACRTMMKSSPDWKSYQVNKSVDFINVFDTYMDGGETLK